MAIQTRVLAGVTIPDTPLITKALAFARQHMNDITYNHVQRSFLFAESIASQIPSLAHRDVELQAVASILHDLGWAYKDPAVSSKDKRFEVDGANVTREFLKREGETDERRLQLAWDAIALHSTASIALHKELEVMLCCAGIIADFRGPKEKSFRGLLSRKVWDDVGKEFPRAGFKDGVVEILCGLCKEKPGTTYDNWVADFGLEYVEGYSREGKRVLDVFLTMEG
jgi:HD domain